MNGKLPIANAICGVKTEHSRHKRIETYDLPCHTDLYVLVTSLEWLCMPYGRFLVFPVPDVTFNFQNPSSITAYPKALLVGMLD
jgi:hypothetical protein